MAEDPTEDAPGDRYPGILRRPWAAKVAASCKEIAEAFFLVLKLNFERGSNDARISVNLSCKALMACEGVVSCANLASYFLFVPQHKLSGRKLECNWLHLSLRSRAARFRQDSDLSHQLVPRLQGTCRRGGPWNSARLEVDLSLCLCVEMTRAWSGDIQVISCWKYRKNRSFKGISDFEIV